MEFVIAKSVLFIEVSVVLIRGVRTIVFLHVPQAPCYVMFEIYILSQDTSLISCMTLPQLERVTACPINSSLVGSEGNTT